MKTAIIIFLILASILCVFTMIVVLVDMLKKSESSSTRKRDLNSEVSVNTPYYIKKITKF